MKKNKSGFTPSRVFLVLFFVVLLGCAGWQLWQNRQPGTSEETIFSESWSSCSPGLRVRHMKDGHTVESIQAEIEEVKESDSRSDCSPDTATFILVK